MAQLMEQWVETEPAADHQKVESLEARGPRTLSTHHHHHHHTTRTTTDDLTPSLDGATRSVYLDNNHGQKEEWTISGENPGALEDLDVKLVDADIGKVLNAFINAQDDEIKTYDPESSGGERGNDQDVHDSAEEYEEEEVLELEFERAIKKLDTHSMHCPRCNNQVTKVILRRKRRVVPKQHKPLNLLGCLPCLSVFVPSGNCFNMFKIFGNDAKKPEQTPALGETISPLHENVPPSIIPSGGTVVNQEEGGCLGLFRVFRNKKDKDGIDNPQQTSAVYISPALPFIDSTQVIDDEVPDKDHEQHSGGKDGIDNPQQTSAVYISPALPFSDSKHDTDKKVPEKDQEQHSKGKDVAATDRQPFNYVPYARLHGRFYDLDSDHPPSGVILPGDVRLDIPADPDEKMLDDTLLPKPAREIVEDKNVPPRKPEGDYRRQDGGALLGQHHGPRVEIPSNLSNDQGSKSIEVVKSIVYGGLMESIASLSIVASAAASDATTLNIVALGLASLIGGLSVIAHNLWDLKDDDQVHPQATKYQELLGQQANFPLHATVAILSFLVFGLVSPMTYGFSFRASDDRDYKILAVAAASVLCVTLLAIGKAYVQRTPKFSFYMKTIMYYVTMAFAGSGVAYAAGHLINKFIKEYGWLDTGAAPTLTLPGMNSVYPTRSSYF